MGEGVGGGEEGATGTADFSSSFPGNRKNGAMEAAQSSLKKEKSSLKPQGKAGVPLRVGNKDPGAQRGPHRAQVWSSILTSSAMNDKSNMPLRRHGHNFNPMELCWSLVFVLLDTQPPCDLGGLSRGSGVLMGRQRAPSGEAEVGSYLSLHLQRTWDSA